MTTLFLVRHGRSTANTAGILAGRSDGVELDETGREQAVAAGVRLAEVPLVSAIASPILRCRQTTEVMLGDRAIPTEVDDRLTECDYGDWTGQSLKELAGEDLWKTVQQQPSAAVFPGGEAMTALSARAVAAVRDWDRTLRARHGDHAAWVAVSHGDVIKAILADALGMHLDAFQRIMVDPASVSVIRYTDARPYVVTMNSLSGDLAKLVPPAEAGDDAAVGGGAGVAGGPETGARAAEGTDEPRVG
ncbi:histidine phosphatase family protein [Granulicoccus sp. GXG6511]|uniref:histidine phosphatase family protein n=1 Tax=Granulicoccus sp. GXG6511 TaxID=3381351 RepID=UPI003D7EAC94